MYHIIFISYVIVVFMTSLMRAECCLQKWAPWLIPPFCLRWKLT